LEARISPVHNWARQVKCVLAQDEEKPLKLDYSGDAAADIPGMRFPVRFQDIVSLVRHYNHTYENSPQPKTARLALVLSGGGAKCAYQAGAVMQIEKQLSQLQPSDKSARPKIDIELVVGTSGGALNAVPIAAGITGQAGVEPPLRQTWKRLNAIDMIRPPIKVQILLGLCFGFIFFVIARVLVWVLRKLTPRYKSEANWIRLLGAILILIPTAVALLFLFPRVLHPLMLLDSHTLFYAMLIISSGAFYTAVAAIICGLLVLANLHPAIARQRSAHTSFGFLTAISWFDPHRRLPWRDLLLLGILLIVVAMFFASQNEGGLFRGPPLERVVTDQYTELFRSFSKTDLASGAPAERLKNISDAIFNNDQRQRDLVITGSSLTKGSRGTKYFYLLGKERRHEKELPSYGSYGVEIGKECDSKRLVDIALGSGTIFPVFPSHEVLESPGYNMRTMQLIDGGFAHNSPIEAAVRWGATHIVLIGASAETEQEGGAKAPVLDNVMTAFSYLYDQAQMADVNAQEEAAVFILRPKLPSAGEGPSIGIIDFGPGFAERAVTRGDHDAKGRSFVRQPARPLFWDTK
jgi:predicted acylesterase/phospholipase RssA